MQRRTFLAMAWSIGTGTWLAGCGGGSSTVTLPGGGNGNPGDRATGAVTGTLARDGSGTLLLIRATDPVPSGATPLDGATLRVAGGGASVRSDASGRFSLQGIPAGLQTLTVEAAGLTSPATLALTVIGGATVDLGVPPVTRAAALDRAKSALAAAGIADLNGVTILSPQQPLPAGVLVVPRLDAAEITAGVPGAKTIGRPSWFFFCDDRVGQPYAHKVRYVYIDAETGEATTEERTSWPTFNAQHFYARMDFHATSPDLVQPGRAAQAANGRAGEQADFPASTASRAEHDDDGKTYGLLVFGFTESPEANLNVGALFGHAGVPAAIGRRDVVDVKAPYSGSWIKDQVILKSKQLIADAGSHDFLLLDINCHGNLDENGEYFMFLPSPELVQLSSGVSTSAQERLRPEEMGLEAAIACRILIIAGTCYAGNWIPYAQRSLDLPGKEITIFCAADAGHVSYGDPGLSQGARNARNFRAEVGKEAADAGQAGLLAAAERASQLSIPYFNNEIATDPKYQGEPASYATVWSRIPGPGEDCELVITPETANAEIEEAVPFEIKINNRPASAPPVRIEVSTTRGELSGGAGTGAKTTLTGPGTVTFKSQESGDAVITAEAFEGSGSSEESIAKVTARVTVASGGGLVYSQIEGNIRGAGFPQTRPGGFHEVDFDGIPPLFEYNFSGRIPPPAAEVNSRECAVLLSRDVAVGTRVEVTGGAVRLPIAEVTIAETENEYDAQENPIRIRERSFQGISGHVTLVRIEGPTRTVRLENVKMRANDKVFGGDGQGTPVSVEGQGTFVVNGSFTVTDTQ